MRMCRGMVLKLRKEIRLFGGVSQKVLGIVIH
jgi:hypothetical protein